MISNSKQVEHKDIDKCNFPKFFVTGMARSGTTLLAAMLSQRPDTYIIPDSLIISRLVNHYKNLIGSRDHSNFRHTDIFQTFPDNINQLINTVEAKVFLSILINSYTGAGKTDDPFRDRLEDAKFIEMIDIKYIFQKIEDSNHGMTWKNFLGILFLELVPKGKKGCPFIGEKAPGHMGYYDYVVKNVPGRKYVIVIKNPIPNIASNYARILHKRKSKMSRRIINLIKLKRFITPFGIAIESYKVFTDNLQEIQQNAQTFVIRYEDLVFQSQHTLDAIADFLNMPRQPFNNKHESVFSHYVGSSIDEKRTNKFEHLLSNTQKRTIKKKFKCIFDCYYPDFAF